MVPLSEIIQRQLSVVNVLGGIIDRLRSFGLGISVMYNVSFIWCATFLNRIERQARCGDGHAGLYNGWRTVL